MIDMYKFWGTGPVHIRIKPVKDTITLLVLIVSLFGLWDLPDYINVRRLYFSEYSDYHAIARVQTVLFQPELAEVYDFNTLRTVTTENIVINHQVINQTLWCSTLRYQVLEITHIPILNRVYIAALTPSPRRFKHHIPGVVPAPVLLRDDKILYRAGLFLNAHSYILGHSFFVFTIHGVSINDLDGLAIGVQMGDCFFTIDL